MLEAVDELYGFELVNYSFPAICRRTELLIAKHRLAGVPELRERLLGDPTFFHNFVEHVLIRVSEFFRDPEFFRVFRSRVIPVLRTYPLLRIWHAGCATGEEVYSLAILLTEEGLYERAQIYGTDLSAEAIAGAKEGIYPARNIRKYTENHQRAGALDSFSSYYRAAYDHIAIAESLKRNILFFQHDLVADDVFGEMQVVLCRNVIIYFGPELRGRVLEKLSRSLCRGGFLCLGSSEGLPSGRIHPFEDVDPRERIFRRTDETGGS